MNSVTHRFSPQSMVGAWLFVIVAGAVWSGVASALPADLLLDWRYVSDPRWSPDGTRLAYVQVTTEEKDDRYEPSVWVTDLAGRNRRLSGPETIARSPRWHPSGDLLGFLASTEGGSELRAYRKGGGESVLLWQSEARIAAFDWSPSGDSVLLQFRDAEGEVPGFIATQRLGVRRDGSRGYRNDGQIKLGILVNVDSQTTEFRSIATGDRDALSPSWAADSQSIFFAQNVADDDDRGIRSTDIFRVGIEPGAEPVAVVTRDGPDGTPLPSPDGRWLATIGFAETDPPASYRAAEISIMSLTEPAAAADAADAAVAEQSDLAEVDLEDAFPAVADNTTAPDLRPWSGEITAEFPFSIADGMAGDVNAPGLDGRRVQWSADSEALYFTSAIRGRVQLVRASIATGDVSPVTRLEQGELGVFDLNADGRVAALLSRPDLPPNIVAFETGSAARGAWQQLTNVNQNLLSGQRLAPYREIRYTHADGTEVQGWLISPTQYDRRRSYPMILYVHGGPHAMYGSNFFFEFQYLANAGYYVLIGNPRGSTGYGSAFGNSVQYRYPGTDYEDLMGLVDEALKEKSIDSERLGVAGGSGGGLLTTWIVGHTDRFKAASAHRSVTNWLSFAGTADYNGYFVDHWFDRAPWADPLHYLERSPISYVDKVSTPVQIIHSDADYRTPLEQSLQYYTALKLQGKPAELVVFRDESHGLSRGGRPSNRVARLEKIRAWFDRYLAN